MNSERGQIRGALAIGREPSRHTLVFGGSDADPDHDAVISIGGEAPGRRAHSKPRRAGHVQYRVASASDPHLQSVIRWRTAETVAVVAHSLLWSSLYAGVAAVLSVIYFGYLAFESGSTSTFRNNAITLASMF